MSKCAVKPETNVDVVTNILPTTSYPNTTSEALQSTTRSVAVSATLPNISDIASFLDANEARKYED